LEKPPVSILLGIANSVSYNQDYDPIDTLNFARQSDFEMVQIYLNQQLIDNSDRLKKIKKHLLKQPDLKCFFHSDISLNRKLFSGDYYKNLFAYLEQFNDFRIIFHYDETEDLDSILKYLQTIQRPAGSLYIENYFQFRGMNKAERNLRKFMAIFSLFQNSAQAIYPVLDIPRFFQNKLGFSGDEALTWCFQLFNFFANRQIPLLLHLIDAKKSRQQKSDYCPIGEGYIPYSKIFEFIKKNKVVLEGIIFEYLDKINTLKSRENMKKILG
jgi:hypothetical protein